MSAERTAYENGRADAKVRTALYDSLEPKTHSQNAPRPNQPAMTDPLYTYYMMGWNSQWGGAYLGQLDANGDAPDAPDAPEQD